jgi:hypothetical protein
VRSGFRAARSAIRRPALGRNKERREPVIGLKIALMAALIAALLVAVRRTEIRR